MGKKARWVVFIVAVVLVALVAPVMATDIFLDEVQGEYSLQLRATEAAIKFSGTHGSADIDTETPVYNDDFFMNAGGQFSGCHIMRPSRLYHEDTFSGTGGIYASFHSSVLTDNTTLVGDNGNLTKDFDVSELPYDSPWVDIRMLLNADSAWIQFAYDGEPGRIQALMSSYGLSEAEATSLVRGDVFGLIAQLSQFGYSGAEVVRFARTSGLDYLRDLLAKLSMPYPGGPIDKAAEKYNTPWSVARDLFREYGDTTFVAALARSNDYKTFAANLKGWDVTVFAGSLLSKTEVTSGEIIHATFRLSHPVTGEQFYGPQLAPYVNVAQVLPNGKLNGLAGYFSYIEFTLDETTGTYRALINTAPDETNKLEPGEYCAFIALRNPGNDVYSPIKVSFTVT